jgi:hypothetical protein
MEFEAEQRIANALERENDIAAATGEGEYFREASWVFTPRPNGCPNTPANTVLTTWSYFRLISGGRSRFDRVRC